jgi:hypothetical protein
MTLELAQRDAWSLRHIGAQRSTVSPAKCDVVTAGFKHSRPGYERASILGDLQKVSHD